MLALAMSGAILLISNILFGTAAAVFASAAVLVLIGTVWGGLPLRRVRLSQAIGRMSSDRTG